MLLGLALPHNLAAHADARATGRASQGSAGARPWLPRYVVLACAGGLRQN